MSDLDLQIGIENEMFLYLKKDKSPGLKLIGQRDIQPFTNILVPLYNKERGEGLLHADFSRDAGHRPSHTGGRKWNVATDDGMGDMGLDSDSRDVEGCTHS